MDSTNTPEAMRSIEVYAAHVPEVERPEVEALSGALRAAAAEAQTLESTFRPDALAAAPKPRRAAVLDAIGRFEARTQVRVEDLSKTRDEIAAGRLVRGAGGGLERAAKPEPTPVSEIRAGEIRAHVRGLDRSARRELVLQAAQENNVELMAALEGAPKGLGVIDDNLAAEVREVRFKRAGWDDQEQTEAIGFRQRIAEKARQALGL